MSNENEKKASFVNKKNIFIVVGIVLAFAISFCFAMLNQKGERRIFFFESENSSELLYETRYLSKNAPQGEIQLFVDEVLLGPITPVAKALFPTGTKVESCFLRDGVLYLDLSEEAIKIEVGNSSDTLVASEILKKNLFTNFRNIDTIKLYIVGKEVYVNNVN